VTVLRLILALALLAPLAVPAAPGRRPAAAKASGQAARRRSPYVGALCADAATGRVLFTDNADAEAYPASVTKLMTLFLVLEDVRAGRYGLDSRAVATPDVNLCEASWIGIRAGESMTVRDLCTALMVESANDAAIVLAVNAAGSFDGFVARMNARAADLGMARTRYYNPNGLPPNAAKRYPWSEFNISTCRDQAKLARELVLKYPQLLKYTSQKTWTMPDGQTILNHNNVMRTDKLKIVNPDGTEAVDGLKTGYIDAGGSSVVLTGKRGPNRAIVIVLGSASAKLRDTHARALMSDALSSL